MAADITYVVDKECPLCEKTFPATKVRSKLRLIRQDSDFNMIYEQINPLYYAILMCPHCGYAAQENTFSEITEKHANIIRDFLNTCTVKIDYANDRSREQAILLFKLAIFFSELISNKSSRIAGLYLRLGWLYREAKDTQKENMALAKALEHYEITIAKEAFPIGNMNDIMADYLIAQLQFLLGKYDQAAASFSRLISKPSAKAEKRIYELSKDTWNEIKAKRKELENKEDDDE